MLDPAIKRRCAPAGLGRSRGDTEIAVYNNIIQINAVSAMRISVV
ncbi:MAG: hypothetical protein RSD75_06960 [Mucinivorans sp.]